MYNYCNELYYLQNDPWKGKGSSKLEFELAMGGSRKVLSTYWVLRGGNRLKRSYHRHQVSVEDSFIITIRRRVRRH